MLNEAGGKWHGVREQITAPLLSPVINYHNSFSVLSEHLAVTKDMDSEEIIIYMQDLEETARENANAIRRARQKYEEWNHLVDNLFSLLEESMADGWKALDVEEASVNELSAQVAVLQKILADVQGSVLPGVLGKEADFGKSFGKILYTALIAGEAVSFLSAGSLFLSVGSTFYEIFSGYGKVKSTVEEIKSCKVELNLRQQALAQTKSLIRFLQTLQVQVACLRDELDQVLEIWDDERIFLREKLSSFRAGADPKKTNLIAQAAAWKTLSGYAKKFMENHFKSDSFQIEL